MPDIPFDRLSSAPHFSIAEDLRFRIGRSRQRAFNSLRLDSAHTEYDFSLRLANASLGLFPDAYGRFLINAVPEKDFSENETGFVVIGDVDCCTVKELWRSLCADGSFEELAVLVSNMAHVRRLALERCALARHSGGLDNYLWDSKKGKMLIKDTDTCVSMDDLSGGQKGAQLLRDVVADLMKVLDITLWTICRSPNLEASDLMAGVHPVENYLVTYFECSDDEIIDLVRGLEEKLLDLCDPEKFDGTYHSVRMMVESVRPSIMICVYRLILRSVLSLKYPICSIDLEILSSAVDHFCREKWIPAIEEWSKIKLSRKSATRYGVK